MAHPNADDGLVPEITEEYRNRYDQFLKRAIAHTKEHAAASPFPSLSPATTSNDRTSPEHVGSKRKAASVES